MRLDSKEKANNDRNARIAQLASYNEMERVKPREKAIEAFKRKPYSVANKQEEKND